MRFSFPTEQGRMYFEKATEDDYISSSMATGQNFYERPYLDKLGKFLTSGDIVVDVGANIGNHAIYFAKFAKSRVLAYEPVEATANTLQVNIALNTCEELIELRKIALGAFTGRAEVEAFSSTNVGATTLRLETTGPVQVSTLDEEPLPRPIRLLKVDAEGMDLDVLKGASRVISEDRPIIGCEAANEETQNQLMEWCNDNHYTVYGVFNATPTYILIPSLTVAELSETVRLQGEALQTVREETRALRWHLRKLREKVDQTS